MNTSSIEAAMIVFWFFVAFVGVIAVVRWASERRRRRDQEEFRDG